MGIGPVIARACPNCGAPVSQQHTLMQCEFCGSALMTVKSAAAPVPISPMAAPHFVVRGPRVSPAPFVIVGVVFALLIGGVAAAITLTRSTHVEAPPPPPPQSFPAVPAPMGGETAALTMFEAQCTQNDAQACVVVGALYHHGQSGAPVDVAKARKYYDRACKLGNQSGCQLRDAIGKGF
jgi:TPR repeat protein